MGAMAVVSKMERFIQGFVTYSARINLQSPEECTPETLVGKLLDVVKGMGAERISVEDLQKHQQWAKQRNAEEEERQQQVRKEAQQSEEEAAPQAVEVARVELEPEVALQTNEA